jgi:hypothetical protein
MDAHGETGDPVPAPDALEPALPQPFVSVGLTGHRRAHPSFPGDPAALEAALDDLLEMIEQAGREVAVHGHDAANARFGLVTLLADGVDQIGTIAAQRRGWRLTAPLPFGRRLNAAIGSAPRSPADARAILAGERPADPEIAGRADALLALAQEAVTFELAESDPAIERAFLDSLEQPENAALQTAFLHTASARFQLAGRILIEQCDILIAVWDGQGTINPGGTGDTARRALEAGVPVLWIDPADPAALRLVTFPEGLETGGPAIAEGEKESLVRALVDTAMGQPAPVANEHRAGFAALSGEVWRPGSSRLSHAYRRVETVFGERAWSARFGSIRQRYERPDEADASPFAGMFAAMGTRREPADAIRETLRGQALARFAWTNGIASQMADRFRSGMVINFTLGALAIISGVLYLPLVDTSQKWIFASIELALLLAIVANTVSGQRLRLHGRWLETRRAAEYLRHASLLFVAGVARPAGSWPAALRGQWPEWYARMTVRGMGLPDMRVDAAYLRAATEALRDHFVLPQLRYHTAKSERLHHAHHAIEQVAERLFGVAILSVSLYLGLSAAAALGHVDAGLVKSSAKWFTVIAVALPTISGALAAIGYFGDFDRFADISQATAGRLDELRQRIDVVLDLPDAAISYNRFADLARAADGIAFAEIQAWQAVFSGKRITVPA